MLANNDGGLNGSHLKDRLVTVTTEWKHVITKTKLLLVLQRGRGVRLFLCFQGGLVDQGDLGGQEDQQVQLGLGHPEQIKTSNNQTQAGDEAKLTRSPKETRTFCAWATFTK